MLAWGRVIVLCIALALVLDLSGHQTVSHI